MVSIKAVVLETASAYLLVRPCIQPPGDGDLDLGLSGDLNSGLFGVRGP